MGATWGEVFSNIPTFVLALIVISVSAIEFFLFLLFLVVVVDYIKAGRQQ